MKNIMGYGIAAVIVIPLLIGAFLFPKNEEASESIDTGTIADRAEVPKSAHILKKKEVPAQVVEEILLDVPLFNQMAAPRLYNGCEVTSLAMIMSFEGFNVSKNQLAQKIKRVPLQYGDGQYGNPNTGFVGDMENGPGLGVYHKPIFSLAKQFAGTRAEDLTGKPFDSVLEKLASGSPVWVIINTMYAPLGEGNFKTWQTPEGPVEITYNMHSVAITGFDKTHIYVNDPYGTKNRKLNRDSFIKAWEQMGCQAVVIN